MAFFGAPNGHGDHASSAVRCALAMQAGGKGMTFTRFPDLHLNMGMGIDKCSATSNINIRTEGQSCPVIGNRRRRPASESNAGPGQILITGSTYEHVRDAVEVRELGLLKWQTTRGAAYDVLRWREPIGARQRSMAGGKSK